MYRLPNKTICLVDVQVLVNQKDAHADVLVLAEECAALAAKPPAEDTRNAAQANVNQDAPSAVLVAAPADVPVAVASVVLDVSLVNAELVDVPRSVLAAAAPRNAEGPSVNLCCKCSA